MVAVTERRLVVGAIGNTLEWGMREEERLPINEF